METRKQTLVYIAGKPPKPNLTHSYDGWLTMERMMSMKDFYQAETVEVDYMEVDKNNMIRKVASLQVEEDKK